jgi:hypothetical protein
MEKTMTSKKALRSLINDSMREALSGLELPKPTKKVEKLLQRNSKKIAAIFADQLKRAEKKKKKTEKFLVDAVNGKPKKNHKAKSPKKAIITA